MNRNFILFVSLVTMLFIWACQPQAPTGASTTLASKAQTTLTSPLKISVDSARNQTNRWINTATGLYSPGSPYDYLLVQGFQIPAAEFKTMLDSLGANPQIWGKLAIQYDKNTKKPYLGLIFQGKPAGDTTTQFSKFQYYDFTYPCPDYCPDK